jgi:tetratricopeptide (TPR) repeat protein
METPGILKIFQAAEVRTLLECAMDRLTTRCREIIGAKLPLCKTEALGFGGCLRVLLANWDLFFPAEDEPSEIYECCNFLERALELRSNGSPSYSFNFHVECLIKFAGLVGVDPATLRLQSARMFTEPDEWERLRSAGDLCRAASEWAKAVTRYTAAIELNPKSAELHKDRALCRIQLSDELHLARQDAEDAIMIDNKKTAYFATLVDALVKLNLLHDAAGVSAAGLQLDSADDVLQTKLRYAHANVTANGKHLPRLLSTFCTDYGYIFLPK